MEAGVSNSSDLVNSFIQNSGLSEQEVDEYLLKIIISNDFYPL
jgi:hypothetical protein